MEWLSKLSTKRLVLAARDIGLDTRLATTREELCEAIRGSPERGRLLKRNVTSKHYEENATKRHRSLTSLVHKTALGAFKNKHLNLVVHWMGGKAPPGAKPSAVHGHSADYGKCAPGREMLFVPLSAAVRVVKETFVGKSALPHTGTSWAGVDPDAFVLWHLPGATPANCLLSWFPGAATYPWQANAYALDDYATLNEALTAISCMSGPYDDRTGAVLVAVPKPVPKPVPPALDKTPEVKEEPKGDA